MASAFQIRHAASIVKRGGIIVYPTDTLYGLGCDPRNYSAVMAINKLKHRPLNKSMILLASEIEQLAPFLDASDTPSESELQTDRPTTWIVPASESCPHWLCHDDNTIAIRLTNHKLVSTLCAQLRTAIISTSANLSGLPPTCDRLSIHRLFRGRVNKMLFSDEHSTGKPSIIINYSDQSILRQ